MVPLILACTFVLLFVAIPVHVVIGGVATALSMSSPVPVLDAIGLSAWAQSNNYILVSIPLFILFGEMLVRSGLAGDMYDAIAPWLNRVPGRLMQTNIATSGVFSAICGSSVATTATITSIALPQIDRHGYNERYFLGSIAAGGTLGVLIPPSINLIVYGSITNTSIPDLYLAAIVPGILLVLLFMGITALISLINPGVAGTGVSVSWREKFRVLPSLLPPALLFLIVIGTIYAGIATPTEAAGLGVAFTFLLVIVRRKFSFTMLNESLLATARTTTFLIMIMIAAAFLNFVLGLLSFSSMLEQYTTGLGLGPYATIAVIILVYIVLGCFLDGLTMTVLTVPMIAPLVVQLGFDPIWFGILVVIVTEIGLVTPPVGMNCFVIQAIRKRGSLNDIFIGVLPYLLVLLCMTVLLVAYPGIALWFR